MSIAPDDIGSVERGQVREKSIVSDDAASTSTVRKVLKVLRDPGLAAALLKAQLCMRGKARLPLSVRLYGRIYFRSGGCKIWSWCLLGGKRCPYRNCLAQ